MGIQMKALGSYYPAAHLYDRQWMEYGSGLSHSQGPATTVSSHGRTGEDDEARHYGEQSNYGVTPENLTNTMPVRYLDHRGETIEAPISSNQNYGIRG